MLLPPQYPVAEVATVDQTSILRYHFNLYYKILAKSWETFPGLYRCFSGMDNPQTNMVIGLPKGDWDEEIRRHSDYFAAHKVPFVWYIDEKANDFFKEKLRTSGFTEVGLFQGVIGSLDKEFIAPSTDCSIELVQDAATMNDCMSLIGRIFGVDATMYKKAMQSDPRLYHWAAKVDGKVVSCLTTLIDGGVVSFWNGATVESMRRHGFSTALRIHALNHAKAQGCHTGTSYLMAEALALGICKKLGYQSKWRFQVFKK